MSDLRKAAQDLLHEFDSGIFDDDLIRAVNALRGALAAPEPEPEPVAWVWLKNGIPVNVFLSRGDANNRYWLDKGYSTAPLYAAPPVAAPEPVRHPGYVIGNHWLETAYERLCAGEAEDAILEDYELVREPRLRDLRRDAERLWQALKRYGKHDDDCGDHDAYNNESMRHCACGLDVVLDETLGDKT